MDNFILRDATLADFAAIKNLISESRLNPMELDWRRFVVAEAPDGTFLGCGQVKPHGELRELASLAVIPTHRGEGIARAIIAHLTERYPAPLYLTCRSGLETFYNRFGFYALSTEQMPPYYRRLSKLAGALMKFSGRDDRLCVMKSAGLENP